MNADDRDFILNILNYDMRPIFASLGFDTAGGEFIYARKDRLDPATNLQIVQGLHSIGLPMDDDWLYETFSIQKPDNYDQLVADREAQREALRRSLGEEQQQNPQSSQLSHNSHNSQPEKSEPSEQSQKSEQPKPKPSLSSRLRGFFSLAPSTGAATDF